LKKGGEKRLKKRTDACIRGIALKRKAEVASFATHLQIVMRGGGKMKKAAQKLIFMVVCLGVMTLLVPSYSAALSAIKLGEETELNIYGWVRNNVGMFLENPQPWAKDSNDLATARTWLRGYLDFKINNQLRFWSAIQFVYEPEYDIEEGASTGLSRYAGRPIKEDGKEYSEYKNMNDVFREAYLEWRPFKSTSFKIGRQIAIWGEALTTRVGDVVQPEDSRFTLAFANLEDTRIPQWMIRGIHDFPAINSTFEWILNPNLVQGRYTVNRTAKFATPVAGIAPERFAIDVETRFRPPVSVTNPAFGGPFAIPGVVITNPVSRDWVFNPFVPGTHLAPTTGTLIREEYPSGWKSLRGGFRTNTTLGGYNFGISYFHTQNYDPLLKRGPIIPGLFSVTTGLPVRYYPLVHPNIDIIGAYMNKQLSPTLPGILRADVIYIPNKPFGTQDLRDTDAIVRRDYIKYMIAYDLSSFLYFPWHKTASFDITFEHVGEVIPDNKNVQYIIYDTTVRQWNPSFNMRISTNWLYNLIYTDLTFGYMPWGKSGLIMPSIKYMPSWMNNAFSFELKYIGIFGDKFKGLGILRSKDMVVFTTQFNW
jgi:hypothetical protein